MKKTITLWLESSLFSKPAEYTSVVQYYPEGDEPYPEEGYGRHFRIETDANDPRLLRILDALKVQGKRPWTNQARAQKQDEYDITTTVIWEHSDLRNSQYMTFEPGDFAEDACDATETGDVRLDTDELHELEPSVQRRLFLGKVLMAQAPRCIIVSQGFRNMIEEARLSGPTFPAQVIFVGSHAERISEKYWVMDANTVAPPMAKELKRFADDEPYQYTEAALATIGNVDCAIRFEHRDCWRFMICSQKFYQLSRRAKVPVECRPIIAVKT